MRVWPRCPALPVAEKAGQKRVLRSTRDEGVRAEDIRREPQTDTGTIVCSIQKRGIAFQQYPFLKSFYYQMTTRLEGARYMPSDFFTLKASYHSGKFLGGIFARR